MADQRFGGAAEPLERDAVAVERGSVAGAQRDGAGKALLRLFEALERGEGEAALRQGRAVVGVARQHPVELAERFADSVRAD